MTNTLGFFTNSLQYKNANIANFVVPLERDWRNIVNLSGFCYGIVACHLGVSVNVSGIVKGICLCLAYSGRLLSSKVSWVCL